MGMKRTDYRWTSFVLLLLLLPSMYLLMYGQLHQPAPSPKKLSEACVKIIKAKQNFIDTSKNGVQCEPLPEAQTEWTGRGTRPKTEYDVQEFMFRSKDPIPRSRDVTVAVQLSIDRLDKLERLGNSWQGPVSASVYIPHPRHSTQGRASISELSAFHKSVNNKGIFPMDLGVVFGLDGIEEMNVTLLDTAALNDIPLKEQYKYLYPINVARNVALAQVRTDLTLLLDVDFVISKQAREAAWGGNVHWANVLCQMRRRASLGQGMFAVLPAFQSLPGQPPPTDKESVISSYKQGFVGRMSGHVITHCQTDFQRWMKSEHDYVIQYNQFFEPYGIAATELIPWFPESFKGYHLNKIMVYFEMAAKGWDFVVLPDHFVVHLWHPRTKTRSFVLENKPIKQHIEKHKDDYIMNLSNRGDTCAPEVVIKALKPENRVLEGEDIKPEPAENTHAFHEVSCAKRHNMLKLKLLFPA